MDVEGPAGLEKARVAKGEAKAVAKTCHIKCTDREGPGRKDTQPSSPPPSQPGRLRELSAFIAVGILRGICL